MIYILSVISLLLLFIAINNTIRLRKAEYNINDAKLSLYVLENNLSDIKKQLWTRMDAQSNLIQRDIDRINELVFDVNELKTKTEESTRLKVLIEAEEAYDIDKDVDMDDDIGIVTAKQLFNDILMRE